MRFHVDSTHLSLLSGLPLDRRDAGRTATKAVVRVACTADAEVALALRVEVARGVERVLDEPAPAAYLAGFGTDGIELELTFWLADATLGPRPCARP